MNSFEEKMIVAGIAAVAAYLIYRKAVDSALPLINPADSNNIINQGATSLYQGVTGSTGTIGGDIYDLFHDDPLTSKPTGTHADPMVSILSGG